ncbi:MAG: YigZ family protein [Methylophaga sp.]|nr:YigZ family protein [Methylophaga sp.]
MSNSDNQQIVLNPSQAEYEIKKSQFIGAIMPCNSEREALQQLRTLATQHPNANHLAFAWRIRQDDGFINERCNDAGEPSGTAGRPILAPLEGNNIINAIVGVIRYFGGVKLGTGGLARAYGTAAKLAIESATLSAWIEMSELKLDIEYSQLQLLEYQLKQCQGQIIDQQFSDRVIVTISLPTSENEQIKEQFTGF